MKKPVVIHLTDLMSI